MKKALSGVLMTMIFLFGPSCEAEISAPATIQNGPVLVDVTGNRYRTVIIDGRTWMADNFRGTKTAENVYITGIYEYENNALLAGAYGRLYTFPAALAAAPAGWHLPTADEWEALITRFGGHKVSGGSLKEAGTTRWRDPNAGASDASEFSAIGGGFRGPDGLFYSLGEHGSYWGITVLSQQPFCVYFYHTQADVVAEVSPDDRESGIAFAVRYVKD